MKADPGGPLFKILKWEPGPHRPSKRLLLQTDAFKVTRTYSLTSTLSAMLLLLSGSAIMCSLTCLLVLLSLGKPAKQFPQNLCHGGLDIMTNRGLGRKRVQSQVMSTVSLDGSWIKKLSRLRGCLLLGHPSCKLVLLRHCLRKNAAKQKRKLRLLRGDAPADMSSSSSSSSSSSNSNSSDNESDESSASQWSHP